MTLSHSWVTLAHLWAAVAHLWVSLAHPWLTPSHLWVTLAHLWVAVAPSQGRSPQTGGIFTVFFPLVSQMWEVASCQSQPADVDKREAPCSTPIRLKAAIDLRRLIITNGLSASRSNPPHCALLFPPNLPFYHHGFMTGAAVLFAVFLSFQSLIIPSHLLRGLLCRQM